MSAPEIDTIWEAIRAEVHEDIQREPMLASFLFSCVLNHDRLEDALSFHLAKKLGGATLTALTLRDLIDEAFRKAPEIGQAVRADLEAITTRDPACGGFAPPLLYFKGFHALQAYRVSHYFWNVERKSLARYLQSRISEVFSVDIHPAARIGRGILMDHATSIVIGETAVVGDNVSMLHEITLGGTGKEIGDRHPKVGAGVLISAGAKILGNVTIGEGAKIGANAVVLTNVPPHTTYAGVPAVQVGRPETESPALEMNHRLSDEVSE